MVTPDYFKTFGIRMTRGRAFIDQDRAGSVPVAIVNHVFVSRARQIRLNTSIAFWSERNCLM
jgi:hypothetical protein